MAFAIAEAYGPRPVDRGWFWRLPREEQAHYWAYYKVRHSKADPPPEGDKRARLARKLAAYRAKVAAGGD